MNLISVKYIMFQDGEFWELEFLSDAKVVLVWKNGKPLVQVKDERDPCASCLEHAEEIVRKAIAATDKSEG